MTLNEKEIEQAFSEAMEEGGPSAPGRIAQKGKALYKTFDDYINEVESTYFFWGYRQALQDHNLL